MGIFDLPPEETVRKIVSLPRWQRNWINNNRSINFSGLCQDALCDVMQVRDPEYYNKHKHLLEESVKIKKDVLEKIELDIKNQKKIYQDKTL